jgi:hypothetical protein
MSNPVAIHEYDLVIYPYKIWVTITDNLIPLMARFKEADSDNELDTKGIDKFAATTFIVEEKETGRFGILIQFSSYEYCDVRNIAHESTHAARYIWDRLDEDITGAEADAYLVGYIAKCIEDTKNYNNAPVPSPYNSTQNDITETYDATQNEMVDNDDDLPF